MRDLISREAELDDEENEDESFDEETGEGRPGKTRENGDMDDSSEEEEDDDDEEPEEREQRRRKRRRDKREEEEAALDEEDLDLIGEAIPEWERKTGAQVCSMRGFCKCPLTVFTAKTQAA